MILLVLTLIRCHTVPYSMAAQSLLQSQQLMSATCIYNSRPEPELVLTARRSGYSRWSWPSRTSTCRTASSSMIVSLPPYQFTPWEKSPKFLTFQGLKLGFSKDQLPVILYMEGCLPIIDLKRNGKTGWCYLLPSFWLRRLTSGIDYRGTYRSPADLLNAQLSLQQTRFLGTAAVQLRQKSHHPPANQAPDMVQQIQEYDGVCDGMWYGG